MKKFVILPLSVGLTMALSLVVGAYQQEDILYTKTKLLGINTLECDVNADGSTDILDLLQIKHDMFKDLNSMDTSTNKVYVSNVQELKDALKVASAGDEIILKEGKYQDDTGWTPFSSGGEGSKDNPIIVRSENPESMSEIMGTDTANNIALHITGDYWIIKDLKISTAQKGIVLDNSNNSVISNCEVYNIGSEGVHFRDNSSYCTIKDSYIHDTGMVSKGYGEGVYIGSYYEEIKYNHSCDYNTVQRCTFKNISAEHVDVKEQTTGTLIEDCIMYGDGMSGENYADSFVDISGNGCIVRNNTCYQDGNSIIVDAFQVHIILSEWGFDNQVYGNTCYFDDQTAYILRGWDCGCSAKDNVRYPSGNTYADDSITVLD